MMKYLLFSLLFAVPAFGQTVSVPIQNPSFEKLTAPLVAVSTCESRSYYDNPGWLFTYDSWIIKPCIVVEDGQNAVLVQNSTISQDTGVAASDLQAISRNGVYVLKFFVTNYFSVYPGYYEVKMSLLNSPYSPSSVTHELCSTDGLATQSWTEVTLTCPAPQYVILNAWPDRSPFDLKAHIVISLSNTQWWPLLFDNVSLTFTPAN